MADSFHKKALRQKKEKKKKEKRERREERKANNDKGKSLEDVTVYLDEFGHFTDVPPDQQKRTEIKVEDIQLGAAPIEEEKEHSGTISLFFPEKGYGFIKEDQSGITVFVHSNALLEPVTDNDRVSYEREKTPKGYAAVNVKKIK